MVSLQAGSTLSARYPSQKATRSCDMLLLGFYLGHSESEEARVSEHTTMFLAPGPVYRLFLVASGV